MKHLLSLLLFMNVCLLVQAQITLEDSLIAYFPFNGNALDESMNGNDGVVNGATLTTDRFGNLNSAYYFDGNDEIKIAAPFGGQAVIGDEFTMTGWFKTTTTKTDANIISIHTACSNGATEDYFVAHISNLNNGNSNFHHFITQLYYHSPFAMVDESNVANGLWNFYSYTYDYGFVQLKVNNNLVYASQVTPKSFVNNPSVNMVIGNHHATLCPFDSYFEGDIDDIRLYNRVLSDNELQDLYQMTTNSLSILTKSELKIFPNPTSNKLSVKYLFVGQKQFELNIYNTVGQSVYEEKFDEENMIKKEVDLSNSSEGMYLVLLKEVENGKIINTSIKKVLLQK